MNEILAPFVQMNPGGSKLVFALFEAFLFRYLERYFCRDESSFLFKVNNRRILRFITLLYIKYYEKIEFFNISFSFSQINNYVSELDCITGVSFISHFINVCGPTTCDPFD